MRKPSLFRCALILVLTLAACTPAATPAPAQPTSVQAPTVLPQVPTTAPTAAAPTQAPLPTEPAAPAAPTTAPSAPAEGRPEEAILILQPGPGSRVTSPVILSGQANPAFEQKLGIRLLSADGRTLGAYSVSINADAGERGPFQMEVPFTVTQEIPGVIQVYAVSARDGGITHLGSVGVTFAPSDANLLPAETQPERIEIRQPAVNAAVQGGTVHVEGYGWASFEQTLAVDVIDAEGKVVGTAPVTVQAPDMGQPGPFSVDVSYQGAASGPGRIVVRDPSPAFGGDLHLASVEVTLQ